MSAGRGVQLIQRKKTIYPEWNTCFDAHLYEGRMIQLIVLQRPNVFVADANIGAQVLADRCKDGGVANVKVSLDCQNVLFRFESFCVTLSITAVLM